MSASNFESDKFTPLVGYWCLPSGHLNDDDRHILTDLYLPILGIESFSLYLLLWEKVPNKELVSQRKSHADLMSLLGIDLRRFYQARIKAEALGLIRTYQKKDEIGPYYIYQLIEPLTAEEFFQDDLLSIFLYEQIGESKFRALAKKYSQSKSILNGSNEITKDFLEVFKLNNNDLINTPSQVADVQSDFNGGSDKKKVTLDAEKVPQLDWEFLVDRVDQLYKISADDLLENQELILSLHAFYDIDENVLSNLIGSTANIVTNKIDPVRLKKAVQDRFEKNSNISLRQQVKEEVETPANDNNLDRSEQLLISQAKKLRPAEFLAAEKQRSNGFPGTVESNALRKMAMKAIMPTAVLNILVHYILQTSPTLQLPLMETVANDWQQNNVKTPEDALKRINDFQNRPRNPKQRYNKPRRIEQATDWSKVKAKVPNKKNSATEKNDLQDRLRKLRNKDN
ncbi:DnaD domain protein [Companilactobacillus sp. HBUAS59544]|uniref:DnaD domain protein n=1 Tax=Companilactobacillus sp. HBUAS59544 TaxID=3109363 RepID=UPI002FF287AF